MKKFSFLYQLHRFTTSVLYGKYVVDFQRNFKEAILSPHSSSMKHPISFTLCQNSVFFLMVVLIVTLRLV